MTDTDLEAVASEVISGDSIAKPWDGMVRVDDLGDLLDKIEEAADVAEEHGRATPDAALGMRIAVAIIRDDIRRGEI